MITSKEAADFVSVKDYTLNYGHDGEHVKIIRTRYDKDYVRTIQFVLLKIRLDKPQIFHKYILEQDVRDLFERYYPELPERFVTEFIEGTL